MFNPDFYPTPADVIEQMLQGENIEGKIILEPSAGKGNIVDYLLLNGAAEVLACENNPDLKKIVQTKCRLLSDDFLTVESHQISHVNLIVMNPPFTADEKHILHAYNIAPAGCKIIALCNYNTLKNPYSESRKQLAAIIQNQGEAVNLGEAFNKSERKTFVEIGLVKIKKPGAEYSTEFEGFFMEEDEEEEQGNGIMSYNVVRDLVNRYVAAIKVYDEQLQAGQKMNSLLYSFYGANLAFTCTEGGAPKLRNDFKKDLQKAGWTFIFQKMNMQKYATKGLKEDINKFVEQQQNIPFTMRNIYKMIEIVIGTHGQRIDKAVIEVFEKLTQHHEENRHGLEGWKTNSHYLLNQKFIHPNLFTVGWDGQMEVTRYSDRYETIDDLNKAICFITGKNYDEIGSFRSFNYTESEQSQKNREEARKQLEIMRIKTDNTEEDRKQWNMWYRISEKKEYVKHEFNKWYDFGFFKVKGFKKGTAHFEFKDPEVWAKFNQRVSKIKGYPLFEGKKQTAYQERQTGRAQQEKKNPAHAFRPTVLFEV